MAYANETGATKIVVATKKDVGPAASGSDVSSLQPSQLGLLDIHTGKFSDGTTGTTYQFVFGVDVDGDGTVDKHLVSPVFKKGALRDYVKTDGVVGQSDVWLVHDYKALCDETCKLSVTVKNGMLNDHFGGEITKEYVFGPVCHEGCDSADCNELTKAIVEAINNDPDGLIKAVPVSYDQSNNTWNEISDLDAYIADHKDVNTDSNPDNDVCSGVKLIAVPAKVKAFCEFNNLNYDDRQTSLEIYGDGCFKCSNVKLEKIQDSTQDIGNWIDVRTMETEAEPLLEGYDAFRRYGATGASTRHIPFLAEEGVVYDIHDLVINLREAVDGSGNWVFHYIVAVPNDTNAAVKNAFVNLFNNLK